MKNHSWFVYIIQNEKGYLYTGITTDIERRFKEHMGQSKGAKFFRSGRPETIVFTKEFSSRSLASKYEYKVKQLKRIKKLELINSHQRVAKC